MRDPERKLHAVSGDRDSMGRFGLEEQRGRAVEGRKLLRGRAIRLRFPESIEKALGAVGFSLLNDDIHNGPKAVAIARRVHAGGLESCLLVVPLQGMRGVLACVTPAPVQPGILQPLVSGFDRDRRGHGSPEPGRQPRVLFHGKVQILVRDERSICREGSRFPDIDRPVAEV